MNVFDRMVKSTLGSGVPLVIFLLAIIAGVAALKFTPREVYVDDPTARND